MQAPRFEPCFKAISKISNKSTREPPNENRHHLLPNLRRLRRRRHRTRPGTSRPRSRHPLHQLRPAHPHEPQRPPHPFPRSRSSQLPSLRPPTLHPSPSYKNVRSLRIRVPRPPPRPLRHPPLRKRHASPLHGRSAPPPFHHHPPRHRHHASRHQPQLPPHHQVLDRKKRRRHRHLPISPTPDRQRLRHQ